MFRLTPRPLYFLTSPLYKSINSSFCSRNHCFLLWNFCVNHSTCSVFWLEVWLASLASGLCFAGNKCNPSGRLSAVVLASLSILGLRLHVWQTPTNFIGPFELFQVHTRYTQILCIWYTYTSWPVHKLSMFPPLWNCSLRSCEVFLAQFLPRTKGQLCDMWLCNRSETIVCSKL